MANELNPNKEVGKSVAQVINSGADIQTVAETLKKAYEKVELPKKEIVAEKQTVSEASAHARKRLAKKNEMVANDEGKKGSISKRLKRVKDKPAQEKAAEKAAQKAGKEAAKKAKKAKKEKNGLSEIAKKEKNTMEKSAKNDKDLAKLKEKEDKKKKKDEKGKDGKSADGKPMDKLDKPDLSKYGIKEVGKDYVMPVTDQNGKTVELKVNDEVNQLKSICNKIDEANKVIEQHNQSTGKPNVSVDPKKAVSGKDIKAPNDVSPKVAGITPEMTETVKREACKAALAEIKAPDGITPKFSEEEIKKLTEAALAMNKGDKLSKGLDEKKREEEKKNHGEKPQSLATPTMQVSGR